MPGTHEQTDKILTTYELTGNIAQSARAAGVSYAVAYATVKAELRRSPSRFRMAREGIRERTLDDVEQMLRDGIEIASERIADRDWARSYKGSDPTPNYLRALSDALRTLQAGEKLSLDRRALERDERVTIRVVLDESGSDPETEPSAA